MFSTTFGQFWRMTAVVWVLTLALAGLAPYASAQESGLGAGILSGPPSNLGQTAAPAAEPETPGDVVPYRIGIGDILNINVWKEPEVSQGGLQVRLDGKITLPLVKEIRCVGMTPTELEQLLQQRFAEFLQAPEVTVIPAEIRSVIVTVTGGVNSPGEIPMAKPMTFVQAVAAAGGASQFARTKKAFIKRIIDEKETRIPVDYDGLVKGKEDVEDPKLLPGDVIVIPQ